MSSSEPIEMVVIDGIRYRPEDVDRTPEPVDPEHVQKPGSGPAWAAPDDDPGGYCPDCTGLPASRTTLHHEHRRRR